MKILVLSDSHSSQSFMRRCVETVKPNAIIHLGDYFADGEALGALYPNIPLYQVPGNCDRFRCAGGEPEIRVIELSGVRLYITHGHKHNVKLYLGALLRDARASGASAALYGHTHLADCHREPDGLWVMNPGSCGGYSGSAGLIEIENHMISKCKILKDTDLAQAEES